MKQLRRRETFGWLGHMHQEKKCRVGLRLFFFFAWGTRAVGQSERLRDENVFL